MHVFLRLVWYLLLLVMHSTQQDCFGIRYEPGALLPASVSLFPSAPQLTACVAPSFLSAAWPFASRLAVPSLPPSRSRCVLRMGASYSSDELRWSKATQCRIRDAEWTRFAAQVRTGTHKRRERMERSISVVKGSSGKHSMHRCAMTPSDAVRLG